MKTVSAAYARANFPELLDRVAKGDRVTISRYNRPVADLVPTVQAQRPVPKFGTGKGKVKIIDPKWADPLTDEEVDDLLTGKY